MAQTTSNLTELFFHDLKEYNGKNFKDLYRTDLEAVKQALDTKDEKSVYQQFKAFSSATTRFFIFLDHHNEITDMEGHILYYKLKLDLINQAFSEYPADPDKLKPFQDELKEYVDTHKEKEYDPTEYATKIFNEVVTPVIEEVSSDSESEKYEESNYATA